MIQIPFLRLYLRQIKYADIRDVFFFPAMLGEVAFGWRMAIRSNIYIRYSWLPDAGKYFPEPGLYAEIFFAYLVCNICFTKKIAEIGIAAVRIQMHDIDLLNWQSALGHNPDLQCDIIIMFGLYFCCGFHLEDTPTPGIIRVLNDIGARVTTHILKCGFVNKRGAIGKQFSGPGERTAEVPGFVVNQYTARIIFPGFCPHFVALIKQCLFFRRHWRFKLGMMNCQINTFEAAEASHESG